MSNINQRDISNNILRNNLNLVINDLFYDLLGYAPYNREILTGESLYNNRNRTQSTFNESNNNIFNILNTINQSNNNVYNNSYRAQNHNNTNMNMNMNMNMNNRSSVGRNRFNINNILNHVEERYSNERTNTNTNIRRQEENVYERINNYNYYTGNSILNSNIIDNRDIISLRTIFRIIDIDSSNNDISYNVFERTYTNSRDVDVSNSFLNRTLSSLFNTINGIGNYNYPIYNTTNRNVSLYSDLSEILSRSLYDKPKYKRKISEKGKEKLIYTKYNTLNHYTMNTSCPIMQIDFEEGEDIIILPCHHCFNPEAINTWLNEKAECPVCRYELDSEEVKISDDKSEDETNNDNDNDNSDNTYREQQYFDLSSSYNIRMRPRNQEIYPNYYNFITNFLQGHDYRENHNENNNNEEVLDEDLEMDLILYYLFDNSSNRI